MDYQSDKPYLGRGWEFPPQFIIKDYYQGIAMTEEEEDIRQSLHILLSTIPGERIFRPEYGCNTKAWVFSKINTTQATLIKDDIEQAILVGEPRITLENIEIADQDFMEGRLDIQLYYYVKGTNSRSNMVYPFYLEEGTDLKITSLQNS